MRAHVIENGIVTNTIEVESLDFLPGLIDASLGGAIGERYENGEFLPPLPQPAQPAAVDAERDRRISAGFEFQGVRYQSRLPSAGHPGDWDVFSGKALEAFIAVSSGAQPGDLRWAGSDEDFAWISADNSRVPMDAQTVIELGKAASLHRSRHTFAGSDLKAMQPIPQDHTDNKWWPVA